MTSSPPTRTSPPSSKRGVVVLLFCLLAATTTAAILQVWTRLKAIEYGYRISKATEANRKLLEINRKLRIEHTLLKDPARIAGIATTELGMQPPLPEQVRRLRLEAPSERDNKPATDEEPGEVGDEDLLPSARDEAMEVASFSRSAR